MEFSEVINLETETEFKNRHRHIFKLNNGQINDDAAEELAEGYLDENGVYHGIDQDEKLFKENERLLQRLTVATNAENKRRLNSDVNELSPGYGNQSTNLADQTAHTDIVNITGPGAGSGISNANPQVRELIQQ